MSEFWVSKKKYFCKYCDIYIADDAPSRQQHENGLRHQGNKSRFVRDLYKSSERKKKDLEEEKRDMLRVEQAANEAFAKDRSLDPSIAAAPVASTSRAPPPPSAPKSSDPYSNYSTAESLGFVDEEAERLAAEQAIKKVEGRAGEWTTIPVHLPPASASQPSPSLNSSSSASAALAEAPADPDDVRGWRLDGPDAKRRRIAIGMGDIYIPGPLNVIRKEGAKKKEEEDAQEAARKAEEEERMAPLPKWTPKTWSKPGEVSAAPASASEAPKSEDISDLAPSSDPGGEVDTKIAPKTEDPPVPEPKTNASVKAEDLPEAPAEVAPEVAGAGMFRKRKHPSGNRGSRK